MESDIFPGEPLTALMEEANELTAILVSCVKNAKAKRAARP